MSATSDVFNFLEDNHKEIGAALAKRVAEDHPAYESIPPVALGKLLDQIVDGYIDLVVTGQCDSVDKIFKALSRVLATHGSRLSDIFKLPLHLDSAIRELLLEDMKARGSDSDSLEAFAANLALIKNASHTLACRFLDVFQEFMDGRIEQHNAYLDRMAAESGVDLDEFKLVPDAS
jgi:hypothetical protein